CGTLMAPRCFIPSSPRMPPPSSPLCPYTTLFRSVALTIRERPLLETALSDDPRPLLERFADVLRRVAPDRTAQEQRLLVLPLPRSEEHTSELQSRFDLVCRLLLEKKKDCKQTHHT